MTQESGLSVAGRRHASPAVERFESWLRSRGYEPGRDPFLPPDEPEDHDDAAGLVREYLAQRPGEEPSRPSLMQHASRLGDVSPLWGDGGCGLALCP